MISGLEEGVKRATAPPAAGGPAPAAAPQPPPRPVSVLRNSTVGGVDSRRAGTAAAAVVLVGLLGLIVALFVAGAEKNARISALERDGRPVVWTVTGCRGLLGGSGSNLVGYVCSGSYVVGGRRYEAAIPGDLGLAPGAELRGVVDPADPKLVTTEGALARERPSAGVFVVPGVLSGVLAVLVVSGAALWRRRARGA